MFVYKDFGYVNYILNLDMNEGLLFYYKCIERINNEQLKIDDDRLWQAFMQQGKENQTFDDYKNEIGYYDRLNNPTKETKKSKNSMTNEEKIIEESRIKKNVVDIRRIIEEKDKQRQLNGITNQIVEG
jgi:hypothetical protein